KIGIEQKPARVVWAPVDQAGRTGEAIRRWPRVNRTLNQTPPRHRRVHVLSGFAVDQQAGNPAVLIKPDGRLVDVGRESGKDGRPPVPITAERSGRHKAPRARGRALTRTGAIPMGKNPTGEPDLVVPASLGGQMGQKEKPALSRNAG